MAYDWQQTAAVPQGWEDSGSEYSDDPWEELRSYFDFKFDPTVRIKFQKSVGRARLSANLCAKGKLRVGSISIPSNQEHSYRRVEFTAKPAGGGSWKIIPRVLEIHKIHVSPFQGRCYVETPNLSLGPVNLQLAVGYNTDAREGCSPWLWGYRAQIFQTVNVKEGSPSYKVRMGVSPGCLSVDSQHYENAPVKARMGWDIKCNYPAFQAGNFTDEFSDADDAPSSDSTLGKVTVNWRGADLIVDMDSIDRVFSRCKKSTAAASTPVTMASSTNTGTATARAMATTAGPSGLQSASPPQQQEATNRVAIQQQAVSEPSMALVLMPPSSGRGQHPVEGHAPLYRVPFTDRESEGESEGELP